MGGALNLVLGDSLPEAGPDIDNARMPGGHPDSARLDTRSDRRGEEAHPSTEVAQPAPGQLRRSRRRTGPARNCVKAPSRRGGVSGASDGLRLDDVRPGRQGVLGVGGGLGGPILKARYWSTEANRWGSRGWPSTFGSNLGVIVGWREVKSLAGVGSLPWVMGADLP